VGNHVDPEMAVWSENVAALQARLPGPCLGVQEFSPHADTSAATPQWLTLPEPSVSSNKIK
jgi:dethiobiotin synthetase